MNTTTGVTPTNGLDLKEGIFFAIFSLAISLAFFFEGTQATPSALSGDQVNILSVCAKLDHPDLLKGDQFVGDIRNVEYYTPFFTWVVRVLSLPDHNYLRGLNILLLLTSLFYLWGWWLLFSLWGDPWVAALLAFLVRGILWPPGFELWGISSLWTMLPRTLFIALLPWGLWAWFRWRHSRGGWLLACFFFGLLANVHPVSGAGIAVCMVLAELAVSWLESKSLITGLRRTAMASVAILLGMAPYIWNYWSHLGTETGVDRIEFAAALRQRILGLFMDPGAFVRSCLRPAWLAIVLLPWALWLALPRKYWSEHKKVLVTMLAFAAGSLVTAILPFYVERMLKASGHEVRFAFQLCRDGKYLLVPSLVLSALACQILCHEIKSRFKFGRAAVYGAAVGCLFLTSVSRSGVFNRVPYFGNDACRMLWPGNGFHADRQAANRQLDGVLTWIREHTDENAKFIGHRLIRVFALRPVVHDWKGAGMLIEGNPKAFVAAMRRETLVEKLEDQNPLAAARVYAQWGADYWATTLSITNLPKSFTDGSWSVYDLRALKGKGDDPGIGRQIQ